MNQPSGALRSVWLVMHDRGQSENIGTPRPISLRVGVVVSHLIEEAKEAGIARPPPGCPNPTNSTRPTWLVQVVPGSYQSYVGWGSHPPSSLVAGATS